MNERNVIGGVFAATLSPLIDGWQGMLIWIVVAFVLIVADLRFGIEASQARGEKIRTSRAIRRTINKFVDYLCWVSIAWVLGGSFGHLFGIPLLPAVVMLGVCAIELSSIISNYFESKGIHKHFNVWKALLKHFHKEEYEDCLEDTTPKNEQSNG